MSVKYDVASVLERETATTFADWYALVEADPELTVVPLSREDRCLHPPEMFRDLVSRYAILSVSVRMPRPQPPLENMDACDVIKGYTAAIPNINIQEGRRD